MRGNYKYLSLVVCLLLSIPLLDAQTNRQLNKTQKDSLLNEITDINKRLKEISAKDTTNGYSIRQFVDSIINFYAHAEPSVAPRDANGLLIVPSLWIPFSDNVTFGDTVIFQPAYLPVVFDGNILPHDIGFIPKDSSIGKFKQFHLIDPDSTFAPQLANIRRTEELRKMYYTANPMRVKIDGLNFSNKPVIREQVVEKKNIFQDLLSTDNAISIIAPELDKIAIKPVFWMKTGTHSLQVSQTSLSDNWNGTGGDDAFSVQNYHNVSVNYKKNKVSFNNTFEWKLDLLRTPADTLHNISIQNDYFRIYSVLGLEAYKKWSYTMAFEAKTPLFNSYAINSTEKRTAIFSPLTINTGIGMSYNLENKSKRDKYKVIKLSADIAPFSINYTFIGDNGVNETKFGVDEGKKSKLDFGSTVNLSFNYSLNRYSSFSSRFKYFTNYQKVIAESENKFTMSLNRYFSTSINLYMRFDDSIGSENRDDRYGYFQYQEMIGFGLSYKW